MPIATSARAFTWTVRKDCDVEECPLHVFMPYRKGGAVKVRKVSEETKAKMRKARERRAQKIDSVAVG